MFWPERVERDLNQVVRTEAYPYRQPEQSDERYCKVYLLSEVRDACFNS